MPVLAFVRRGAFVRHLHGGELLADANQIAFFDPGDVYRVSHPAQDGDACTAFAFAPETAGDALSSVRFGRSRRDRTIFPVRQATDGSRATIIVQALRRLLDRRCADALEVEELATWILGRVVAGLESSGAVGGRPVRPGTRESHRRIAARARLFLEARHAGPVSLAAVASAAGCAPFHLTRIFRRQTGIAMHRYLNRLRLRAALERFGEGVSDLTDLALDLGFSSHAHFSTVFRRELGLPPSQFRRCLSAASLREISKNLKA